MVSAQVPRLQPMPIDTSLGIKCRVCRNGEESSYTEIIAPTGAESAVNPLGSCGKTNQSAVMPTGSPRNNRAEISFAIFMLLMKR